MKCDCGAESIKTTHSTWCSVLIPKAYSPFEELCNLSVQVMCETGQQPNCAYINSKWFDNITKEILPHEFTDSKSSHVTLALPIGPIKLYRDAYVPIDEVYLGIE